MTHSQDNLTQLVQNPFREKIIVSSVQEALTSRNLKGLGWADIDWPHIFYWSENQKVAFSQVGIELPDAMTKFQAWEFLKAVKNLQPKYKKHQKSWDGAIRRILIGYGPETKSILQQALIRK